MQKPTFIFLKNSTTNFENHSKDRTKTPTNCNIELQTKTEEPKTSHEPHKTKNDQQMHKSQKKNRLSIYSNAFPKTSTKTQNSAFLHTHK